LQFKATKDIERKPATLNALEKYLGSGLIKGVGPSNGQVYCEAFWR
jgi:exodeoxyribonuclease V alpha subunit